jgi:DNA-binding transcriptional MerR regulator
VTDFSTPSLRIGQAAQASCMSAASIRFYEQQGLLGVAVRSHNGYRCYSAHDVDQLRLIRTCRSLDMSLAEIRQLLNAPTDSPAGCDIRAQVLQQHQDHVQARITELQQLQQRLSQLLQLCNHTPDLACPTQVALKNTSPLSVNTANSHPRHI